jgi:hypothetical protein
MDVRRIDANSAKDAGRVEAAMLPVTWTGPLGVALLLPLVEGLALEVELDTELLELDPELANVADAVSVGDDVDVRGVEEVLVVEGVLVVEAGPVLVFADAWAVTATLTTGVEPAVTWAVATTTLVVSVGGCTVTVWTLVVSTSDKAETGAQNSMNGANSLSI